MATIDTPFALSLSKGGSPRNVTLVPRLPFDRLRANGGLA
jgi:hypothetical protein